VKLESNNVHYLFLKYYFFEYNKQTNMRNIKIKGNWNIK